MQNHEKIRVDVQSHWLVQSVISRAELSKLLLSFGGAVRDTFTSLRPDARDRSTMWCCVDHGWQPDERKMEKFSLSSVELRIDSAMSDTLYERHFFRAMLTLLDPGPGDLLTPSRHAYQVWLLNEVRRGIGIALGSAGQPEMQFLAERSHFWIYGEPGIYAYDDVYGNPSPSRQLPQPEDSFFDVGLVIGRPPGDDSAARGDGENNTLVS